MQTTEIKENGIHHGFTVSRFRQIAAMSAFDLAHELGFGWDEQKVILLETNSFINHSTLTKLAAIFQVHVSVFYYLTAALIEAQANHFMQYGENSQIEPPIKRSDIKCYIANYLKLYNDVLDEAIAMQKKNA